MVLVPAAYWRGVLDMRASALWLAAAVACMSAAFGLVPDEGYWALLRFVLVIGGGVTYVLGLRRHMRGRRAMQSTEQKIEIATLRYQGTHTQVKGLRILAWGMAGIFVIAMLSRPVPWAPLLLPAPIAIALFGASIAGLGVSRARGAPHPDP